jgi:diguanylate cyclase (GGDEF)-like protein
MDIKTLVLVLALGHLSLGVALLFARVGRAPEHTPEHTPEPGLALWALAKQCQAAAWLLVWLRGSVPDLFSVLLANGLLFTGVALDAGVFLQAAGRHRWRRVLMPLLVLALLVFVGCYVAGAGAPLRLAAGALIVALFVLTGAVALALDWPRRTTLQRYMALATAALALLIGARGALMALAPEGLGWLTPALLQATGLAALYLVMLSNGFGVLLLSRERLQAALVQQEVRDSATGVPNRRGFFNTLAPWMALARRPGMPTALVVLNLDHFKRINDSYGHQVGDMLLKSVVGLCQAQLRDSDQMGRLGGAEFAILLPRTGPAEAMLVAERLRAAIAGASLKTERAVVSLTASLGVTGIRAEDSVVSLFKRADEALQAAKQGGRNRVQEALAPVVLAV